MAKTKGDRPTQVRAAGACLGGCSWKKKKTKDTAKKQHQPNKTAAAT